MWWGWCWNGDEWDDDEWDDYDGGDEKKSPLTKGGNTKRSSSTKSKGATPCPKGMVPKRKMGALLGQRGGTPIEKQQGQSSWLWHSQQQEKRSIQAKGP